MATERELNILIKAKDMASATLDKYGKQFSSIGKSMLAVGAAGMAGFGTAVKVAADFESQMSKVKAISGATDGDFAKLTKTAQDLGAKTTKSASEVAQGMEGMAAMGFNANQIMAAMPGVISAAEASGADMAQTADTMSAALNIFGLKASDASKVADVLAKTANMSAADITDMQYALKYAGPPAASLGVSLEELSASIGIMTNAGMKGEQAGTSLRGALLGLLNPSEKTAGLMEDLGLKVTDNKGNFVGLANLVDNLQGSMKGMTKTQKAATLAQLVGKEAVSGMLSLMDAGPAKINKMTTELEHSAGSSAEASKVMTDNLNGALEQMGGAFESAAIIIGSQFTPYIRGVAQAVGDAVTFFNDLPPSVQSIITKIALAATVFMLLTGALLVVIPMLPALGAAIGALFGPVGLVIALCAALYAAFLTNFGGIRDFVMQWVTAIQTAFSYLTGGMDDVVLRGQHMGMSLQQILGPNAMAIVQVFGSMKDQLVNIFMMLQQTIEPLWIAFGQNLAAFWNQNGAQIVAFIQNTFNSIVGIFTTVLGFIMSFIQQHGVEIIDVVSETFNAVWQVISAVMSVVSMVLQTVWTGIQSLIKNHGDQIMSNVMTAFNGIARTIQIVSNLITQIIQWAFPYIKQIIQIVMQYVAPFVIQMFGQIAAFIGDVMPKIVQIISWAWKSVIQPLLTAVMNTLVPLIRGAFQAISGIVGGVMNIIMGVIKTVLSIITGDWSGAWAGIKQILSGAVQAIGGIIRGIVTIVSTPFRAAINAVQGFGSAFFNVGKDIIMGMINGIKSAIGGVVNAAKDAAKGAMNAVKGMLGIHSPSRVFAQIGAFTSEGFANGIKDAANLAVNASKKMANATIQPVQDLDMAPSSLTGLQPTGTDGGSGQGNGPTIILQFNEGSVVLPNVTNGDQFVQDMQGYALRQALKNQ